MSHSSDEPFALKKPLDQENQHLSDIPNAFERRKKKEKSKEKEARESTLKWFTSCLYKKRERQSNIIEIGKYHKMNFPILPTTDNRQRRKPQRNISGD